MQEAETMSQLKLLNRARSISLAKGPSIPRFRTTLNDRRGVTTGLTCLPLSLSRVVSALFRREVCLHLYEYQSCGIAYQGPDAPAVIESKHFFQEGKELWEFPANPSMSVLYMSSRVVL